MSKNGFLLKWRSAWIHAWSSLLQTWPTRVNPWMCKLIVDISKAVDSVCHRLLVKKTVSMGILLKITRWVEAFLKNRTFRVKLEGHPSSEGIVKRGVPQGSGLGPLLFLIFINDLENELTCNHLFFADDVKLIAPKSQQHGLKLLIEQALNLSRRWDLPLNANYRHHL